MLRTQTGLDKTPGINRTLALHDPKFDGMWDIITAMRATAPVDG
jgi:hypothetical protein